MKECSYITSITTTILRHSAHNLQVKDKQFSSIYRPVICVIYKKNDGVALIEQFPFLDMRVSSDLCIDYSFTCPLKKKTNLYTPFILSKLIQIIPSDLKRKKKKKNTKRKQNKKKIVPKLSIPLVLPHHHKCLCVCVFII